MLRRPLAVPPFGVALTLVAAVAGAVAWQVVAAHRDRDDRLARAELAERNRQLALLDVAPPPNALNQPWQPPQSWPARLGSDPYLGLYGLGDFGEPVTDTRSVPLWQREPPRFHGWSPLHDWR